jgi:divalent metal cation (Fe/Co/Zn/Cd) transporter
MNAAVTRADLVRRGTNLEWFTVVYNSLEGLVSVAAGLMAGSVSLVGFGLDSVIEVISGAALLWRFHRDEDSCRRERAERQALLVVGGCFLALAVYICAESALSLWHHEAAERSVPGIAIAALSVLVMPLLARAKRRVAAEISSGALLADARQTDFCLYLSVILLAGLLLNALLGWWWADSVAALAMTPIIAWEGVQGLKGKSGCGCR